MELLLLLLLLFWGWLLGCLHVVGSKETALLSKYYQNINCTENNNYVYLLDNGNKTIQTLNFTKIMWSLSVDKSGNVSNRLREFYQYLQAVQGSS